MKRLLSLLLIATILCGLFAGITVAAETTGTTVYLKPNSNWLQDNARFAAYLWDPQIWIDCTDSNGDGIYEVQVPAGYTNIILCRMNPNKAANNWNNKWNQTKDLKVPTDDKVLCVIADGAWDGSGSWTTLSGSNPAPTDPPVTEIAYYVAGTTALCGSSWNEKDAANKMTHKGNGIYEKVFDEVPGGTHKFKVTDGTWTNSWGANGSDYAINLAISSKVTITFNSNTKAITVSTEEIEGGVAATEPDCYYVAGTAGLCGSEWQCADEANKMTEESDDIHSKTYTNVPVGEHKFKVTAGTWDLSWGDNGSDYVIILPAVSNVTITFNSETKAITVDIACQHKNTKIEGASPATCGKDGYTGDTVCECGETIEKGEPIPATGNHSYNTEGACTVCGAACPHTNTTLKNDKEETCGTAGYTGDKVCDVCGVTVIKGKVIPATGNHNYKDGICTVCGDGCNHSYQNGKCQICGIDCTHSYKDGKCETCGIECTHTTELQGAKAATCTEAGHEGNLVCTICNKVVKQGNEIPALNHKNTETRVEGAKDATCGAAGHTGKTICECGATISEGEEIPATGNHNYKDGTCSVCGGKDPNYVAPANRILYVKPNAGWLESEARFAAYFFNDGGNTWVDCTASSVAGVWQVEIPADFADGQVIFCRMNPATTENNWDNKWNQTSDLPIPAANDNKTCYHVVGWDHGAGQWTKLGDEPEAVKTIYYVAGSFGTEGWNKHHQMTESADGASWSLSMDLKAGTYEYKVKDNGTGWWPEANVQLVLEQDASVEFTIDVATKAVTHKITPKSVEPEDTTPETTAPEDTTPEYTTPETTEPKPTTPDNPDTIVVYAQVPESWTDVGVYIWDGSGKYDAAWPGIQMTKGADGWYTAEVPAWAENIIINNNGNGAQTQDMAITVGRDLWIVVEAAESGFVGTVSYESAKTGDSTNLIALSVAMLLAAAGMVTLVVKKKEF